MRSPPLRNVLELMRREFYALGRDRVMLGLIVYAFSVLIYVNATATGIELRNAAIAFVDEDASTLSARLFDAPQPPYFQHPQRLALADVDAALDAGRFTFVVDVPPGFQSDVLAGRAPRLQINVDATAMSQAGIGANYLQQIFSAEIDEFVRGRRQEAPQAVTQVVRIAFNPNLQMPWFMGPMMIVNSITLLSIVLTGAALIREREQGTLEHLLVLPLTPIEIMLAKIGATALVIVVATTFATVVMIHGVLSVPARGSLALFLVAAFVYSASIAAIGIFLATLARSMPQLGLLSIPVVFPMAMLSGGATPLDSMPV
ncbi:MAG TPA: ABC transporter permease, partial [Plasticicumulans sp.]